MLTHYINYQLTPQTLIKQNIRDNLSTEEDKVLLSVSGEKKNRVFLEMNGKNEVKFNQMVILKRVENWTWG